jgi:MFS family permease
MNPLAEVPLPADEPRRSLRYSNIEGSCWMLMASVAGGAIVTAYAADLGATDLQFSLLTGMSTLAAFGAVLGAYAVGRTGSRRKAVLQFIWNRLLWFVPAAVALTPAPPGVALATLLLILLFHSLLDNALGAAWLSWMTDLVPPERRNRYFGWRNALIGAVGMIATWLVGRGFDLLKARVVSHGQPVGLAYAPFFLFAALGGVASIFFMRRQWEPPLSGERPIPLQYLLALPLRHREFRRLLVFHLLWTFVCGVTAPFWRPQMIKHLDMNLEAIAIYGILSGVVGLAAQPIWGRIIDRIGSRPVIVLNQAFIALLPLLWLFARPDFLWMIWVDALLTGAFWPGFTLAVFNLNMQTAPQENRTAYFAAVSLVTGLTGFAANLAGGRIALSLDGFQAALAGFPLNAYHVIFVLSTVGRIALLPAAMRLPDSKSGSVGLLINLVGDKVQQMVFTGLQQGVALVRHKRR